jgi:hypothetical protein
VERDCTRAAASSNAPARDQVSTFLFGEQASGHNRARLSVTTRAREDKRPSGGTGEGKAVPVSMWLLKGDARRCKYRVIVVRVS